MDRKPRPSAVATPARLLVAVMVDIMETFFREIVAGVAQYGREVGDWQLQVVRHPADWAAAGREWHGLIACLNDERVAAVVESAGVPTVAVGSVGIDAPQPGIVQVNTDNERLAAMAFEHLRERGLATFGYYGAPPTAGTRWSVIRGDRFGAIAAAAGHACDRLTGCDADAESPAARQELADWLTGLPKPVGIMACSDLHGRVVLEACRATGLRVPYDVAVVGVDNDELECELAVPPLTSIPQAARRIGHEAARLLDHLISPERFAGEAAAGAVPRVTLIPPASIIPRASTETFVVADPVIARVIEAVREQACRGLTIADLVAISGLPRWKLEKQFKQAVGHSIHDDIVRVRLSEARRLIRTTDLPLKVVSNRSGFHSVAYMTTIFRRRFGTTPARFRRVEQGGVVRAPDTDDEGQE
jgi:LacI family transcriptional regulator